MVEGEGGLIVVRGGDAFSDGSHHVRQ
jgi:hypothetical protein